MIEEKGSPTCRFGAFCCMVASILSLSTGYQVGVISGVAVFMKEDLSLSDEQVEVVMSLLSFVSIAGTAVAGRTCDKLGRRFAIMLSAVFFVVGSAAMALAPNYSVVLMGRTIVGIGFGYSILVPTMYTAEISPSNSRGVLSCMPEMSVNVGILVGYVANYALSGLSQHLSWRLMVAIGIIPALIMLLMVPMMPETPQWLAMKGRREEAMSVLIKSLGGCEDLALARLEEITEGIEYAREKAGNGSEMGTWGEILRPSPVVRRMLTIGIGVQLLHQVTGIGVVIGYSPSLFRHAGISSESSILAATMAVGLTKASFVAVAAMLIERTGRRGLLMVSLTGMAFWFVLLGSAVMLGTSGASAVAVAAACGAVAVYSVGLGPLAGIIGNEIYPSRIRSKASSVAIMLNRLSCGGVYLTFLTLSNATSVPAMVFAYAGIGVLGCAFVYYVVPETKGKSLEEIVVSFHAHARPDVRYETAKPTLGASLLK